MKIVIACCLSLFLSVTPRAYSQEGECRDIYVEGIGWTNTFGFGRCPRSSDTDDLGRLAAGVLVASGVLYLLAKSGEEENQLSSLWSLTSSRDSVIGAYLDGNKRIELRLLSLRKNKDLTDFPAWGSPSKHREFEFLSLRWNLH